MQKDTYGKECLPIQVRDHALKITDDLPRQGANRDFFVQNQERALAATDGTTPGGALATIGADHPGTEMLKRLQRTGPYYKRNAPHICSFFVKGECKRGEECPYRHEKPTDPDDPLSQQNMRDRYYGNNDPVAEKILNRATGGNDYRVNPVPNLPTALPIPDELIPNKPERLASMGLSQQDVTVLGAPISKATIDGDREYNTFFLGLAATALAVNVGAFATILYCGTGIHKFLKMAVISERTRRQQRQLFRALVVQTTVPMVCIFIPAIVFALGSVFE
ncbi:unnamed protein product, partial [Mesorhabditis spiculigera]